MSILIKGMEMPKSCRDCGIEQDGFWCGALDGYQNTRCFTNERREDCPLVTVPPHGRLIDADALYENCVLDNSTTVFATAKRINEYMQLKIDNAPTIIPAEPCNDLAKPNNAPTVIEAEEVYGQYTDTAGNYHWCGTHSGEHVIKAEEGE